MDEDLQAPGIEDRHMYTGPQKYDYWLPYGGPGRSEYDEAKDPTPRRRRKKRRHGRSPNRIALDFDGTITAAPPMFKKIVTAVHKAGGKCYVVSGRRETDRELVEMYLGRYGIKHDGLHLYPRLYVLESTLDFFTAMRVGRWKADILDDLDVEVFVEDNPIFIKQVARRLPHIWILKPVGGWLHV